MNMVELCTNQSIAAIFPSDQCVSQYHFYNLNSRYDELRVVFWRWRARGIEPETDQFVDHTIPPIPEQRAIADVLNDMEMEISALDMQQVKTRLIKQGMMQELLTGRTRLVSS